MEAPYYCNSTDVQENHMDDPLRPKTVPLSAETILWFEFLLDPTLLTEHLAKINASEYLVKFN